MTAYTTLTLLNNVVYGVASGNYDGSSQDFYSNAVPAVNYYGGQGALQTITYRLQNVVARITIQATLNDQAEPAHWFDVDTYGNGVDPVTETHPVTVVGNFVWLRARVESFDGGTIQAVSAAY
jgi:hypothetical protein